MITVQLSMLTASKLVSDVKSVYLQIREMFSNLEIPIHDIYAELVLSTETEKLLFEYFPVQCEHYGSSLAFYNAFRSLNYFMNTYQYLVSNKIEFTSLALRSEDILLINSFTIFRG